MQIELWKVTVFGNIKRHDGDLQAFIDGGCGYATWSMPEEPRLSSWRTRIPMTPRLASEVLGAAYNPCSYVGQEPEYGKSKVYRYRHMTSGEDAYTVYECSACGLYLRQDSVTTSIHPPTECLTGGQESAALTSAEWYNRNELNSSSLTGTLVILTHGAVSRNRIRSKTGLAFPKMTIVANGEHYTMLAYTNK